MIERVITAFQNLGFDLNDTEIADILWLAVQMRRSDCSSVSEPQQQTPTSTSKTTSPSPQLPLEQNINSSKSTNKTEARANIYPQSSQDSDRNSSGLPIKVPAAQALRNQLEIARALRPLKRRVPSKREFVLDEAATAERIAKEKLLLPVMKPAPERWLELALVVDEGASMMLWTQTIKELRQLLERHGAFRDVRTWGLFISEGGKVLLRPRTSSVLGQKRLHHPKELIDPNGRRLFVIISDCVSPAWRSGAITKALAAWACSSPTVIIQVLPEWLWERSALGVAESILLRSLAPGVPNQQLIMTALDLFNDYDVTKRLKVPVVTLEPESLKNWAWIIAGVGDVQTKGFLLTLDGEIFDASNELTRSSSVELTAKQRLQRFRLTASPMARKLAGLLASVPISLPTVRLIQQTMLPQSNQVHVAEVFLGGILKPLSPVNEDGELDKIQFDFADGVRDLLLDSVPLTESTEVLRKVSEYVAQRSGLSVDGFTAMLVNPGLVVDSSSGFLVRPFAQITAKVLRRLGGKYEKIADELEFSQKLEEDDNRDENELQQVEQSISNLLYQQLDDYLKNGHWEEANRETYRLMIQMVGKEEGRSLDSEDLKNFSCKALRRIDQLWMSSSQGKFGFSVQKKIFEKLGDELEEFMEEVGWWWKGFGKQKVTLYLSPELHRKLKIRSAVDSEPMSELAEEVSKSQKSIQTKQKVTLYLSPELHRKLKIRSAIDSEPMSELAEKAFSFYLSRKQVMETIANNTPKGHFPMLCRDPQFYIQLEQEEQEVKSHDPQSYIQLEQEEQEVKSQISKQAKQKVTLYLSPELYQRLNMIAANSEPVSVISQLAEKCFQFYLSHTEYVEYVEDNLHILKTLTIALCARLVTCKI